MLLPVFTKLLKSPFLVDISLSLFSERGPSQGVASLQGRTSFQLIAYDRRGTIDMAQHRLMSRHVGRAIFAVSSCRFISFYRQFRSLATAFPRAMRSPPPSPRVREEQDRDGVSSPPAGARLTSASSVATPVAITCANAELWRRRQSTRLS